VCRSLPGYCVLAATYHILTGLDWFSITAYLTSISRCVCTMSMSNPCCRLYVCVSRARARVCVDVWLSRCMGEGWGGYCSWTPDGYVASWTRRSRASRLVFRTGLQNEQRILSSRSPNTIGRKVLLIDPGLFRSTATRGTRRSGKGARVDAAAEWVVRRGRERGRVSRQGEGIKEGGGECECEGGAGVCEGKEGWRGPRTGISSHGGLSGRRYPRDTRWRSSARGNQQFLLR
jgi:hypothetical protein